MLVEKLQELLMQLPKGTTANVNAVRNLKLSDANGEYIGFIDFATGELVLFDNEKDGMVCDAQ